MKQKHFLPLLVVAILFVPFAVKAASVDVQAQIRLLLTQIADLQAQLTTLQNQQSGNSFCHTFNTNLKFGDSGSEVEALNLALNKDSLYNNPTSNNFDESTASAVVSFQAKYGILQTGYVGRLTRTKLNSLYPCTSVTADSFAMQITSVGNNVYSRVITSNAPFNKLIFHTDCDTNVVTLLNNGTYGAEYCGTDYTINLPVPVTQFSYPITFKSTDNASHTFSVSVASYLDGKFLAISQKQVTINGLNTPIRDYYIQGMRIQVLKEGSGVSVQSGDSVTLNYSLKISSGTTVDSRTAFTFTLGNGSVIKGIDLGVIGMKKGEIRRLIIPSELAYGQTGIVNIIPANSTVTVEIELTGANPGTVQSTVQIASPNQGDQWQMSGTYSIRWFAERFSTSDRVNIILLDTRAGRNYSVIATGVPAYDFSGVGSPMGSYSWTIPTTGILPSSSNAFKIYVGKYMPPAQSGDWEPLSSTAESVTYGYGNSFSIASQNAAPVINEISSGSVHGQSAAVVQGQSTIISLYGYNFTGTTGFFCGVNPSALDGISVTTCNSSASSIGLVVTVNANATLGSRQVTVSTANGTSNAVTLTVLPAATRSITVTSPNGGENWRVGETHRITWTSQGVDRVALYIYNDTIAGSGSTNYLDFAGASLSVPASQGYFDWTINSAWLPKTSSSNNGRYKISINDAQISGVADTSDNYFTITP